MFGIRGKYGRLLIVSICISFFVSAGAGAEGKAEEKFPSRELEIMVPWPAGGSTDIAYRIFSGVAPRYLGFPVVIVNKAGRGGVPGYVEAMSKRPDGHYLTAWTNQSLAVRHIKEVPFDLSSFTPVVNLVTVPVWILTAAASPYSDLDDLAKDAMNRPDRVRIGNAGAGSGPHLVALAFEKATGVRFDHVCHAGDMPAIAETVSGRVDALAAGPPVGVPQLEAGKLKCLGVFSEKRLPRFPSFPTAEEQGFEFIMGQWRGLAVPKGTDPKRIKKLQDAFKAAMDDSELRKLADKAGLVLDYRSTEDFRKLVEEDDLRYDETVKAYGLGEKNN